MSAAVAIRLRPGSRLSRATSTRRTELEELGAPTTRNRSARGGDRRHGPLAVGGGVADVLVARAVDRRETAAQHGDDGRRYRRSDSVVWVDVGEPLRIGDGDGLGIGHGLDQEHRARRHLAHGADRPRDGRHGRSAARCAPAFVMALDLAVDLGDQRAGGVGEQQPAAPAPRPAPPWARRGPRRPPARRRAPRPAPRRTRRPAPAARPPRGGCGRSRGGHRPAAPFRRSASLTMSIARSTPAQNPRGPARRIGERRQVGIGQGLGLSHGWVKHGGCLA